MYYTSQRAYTNIVWQKLEEEDYDTLLKENPFKHSIVGDVAAAANAHRNCDLYLASLRLEIEFYRVVAKKNRSVGGKRAL